MDEAKRYALINSLGTTAYVIFVVLLINFLDSHVNEENLLTPIAGILFFVFSAATTGSLVFGRPILWYLDGEKQKAVHLLLYTLGMIFVIMLIFFSLVIFLQV